MITYEILNLFPTPVYITKRKKEITTPEMEDIKSIIETGAGQELSGNEGTWLSDNSYIFNTNPALVDIKEFCEEHIKIFVKEFISPGLHNSDVKFYITQSWLTWAPPGGSFHKHWHNNCIISGVFYIATPTADDEIYFFDPNCTMKNRIDITNNKPLQYNKYNSSTWNQKVSAQDLILFPSWLEHGVLENKNVYQSANRISIGFNVFAKGHIGEADGRNELIL